MIQAKTGRDEPDGTARPTDRTEARDERSKGTAHVRTLPGGLPLPERA